MLTTTPPRTHRTEDDAAFIDRRTFYSVLALWHLLSLDAPTVAVVWTCFIARCTRRALPWPEAAAMFFSVWMIYAGDRLLDARRVEVTQQCHAMEARHRFHHRHRDRFVAGMTISACALVFLLPRIDPASFPFYAATAVALCAWLLVLHSRSSHQVRLPKELAVGIFFPTAVFVPAIAPAVALPWPLLPESLLFGLLCALNCLYLYQWEHPPGITSATPHWTTALGVRNLLALTWLVIGSSAALATAGRHETRSMAPALAIGISAALLLALHAGRTRLASLHLRAFADLVLLTPLFLWAI